MRFSPNSLYLGEGGDKGCFVWKTENRQQIGKIAVDRCWSIAFSPDGLRIAIVGEDYAEIRAIANLAKPLLHIPIPLGLLEDIAFSADGKTIATFGESGKLRLWDADSGESLGDSLLNTFGRSSHLSIVFSRDGKYAAVAGERGTELVPATPYAWTERNCSRANRNLSLTEWLQYLGKDVPYERSCPSLPDGVGVKE
jgi:WD40 repeat protein